MTPLTKGVTDVKKLIRVMLTFVIIGSLIYPLALALEEEEDEAVPFIEEEHDEATPFVEEEQDEATFFEEEVQDETAFFVEKGQDEAAPSVEEEQVETTSFIEEEQVETAPFIEEEQVEVAFFESKSSMNTTIHNVATFQDLESAINNINANSNHTQEEVIRITQDILVPGSRVLSIRRPNVYLSAGAGHFRIQSTASNVFMVQNNGGFTVSGGSEGGSLEIRGANNYGSAIIVASGGWAEVADGASITNYPESAVRVLNGGYFRLLGTARLYLNRAVFANTGGGGVHVAGGGVFEMFGGIIEWNTAANGGGVRVITGGTFRMFGGEIRNNYATSDGGGLFVDSDNLDRITINPAAAFFGNVAQNGKRIDNQLAEKYRHQINPGTVSVTTMGDFLIDGGSFAGIDPHAFTNYDINTDGPRFWRVTYAVREGQGTVVAKIAANDVLIPNGAFVPEGTDVFFVAESAPLLNRWDIGTRAVEANEDGVEIPFNFTSIEPDTPLLRTITVHTNAIASFSEGVSITKHPNGGLGDSLVRWVPKGAHTLTHEPTHANEAMRFLGWNTETNGQGAFYPTGGNIEVTEHISLYAQWELPTVAFTLSKEVTGEMANRSMGFEFTLTFRDSEENLLPKGTQFHYFGDTLPNLGASAPTDGTLTLDENGSAVLRLTHGQVIRIEDIIQDSYIQVVETPDLNYKPAFKDSESDSTDLLGNDTGTLSLSTDRAIHFCNERIITVPPTGLDIGSTGTHLLLIALTVFPALLAFAIRTVFHYRKSLRLKS